jgi:hypothetical protein
VKEKTARLATGSANVPGSAPGRYPERTAVPHTIEPAASGRAKCRGCGRAITKGELRFGERFPNPYADEGDMTLWFHLACGAFKRPESLLEALEASEAEIEPRDWLASAARKGIEHRRLPRLDGAERAPTGRAACRACREKIPKDGWRLRLVFFEDERFQPSGFIHAACAETYLGTAEVVDRARHFSPELSDADVVGLESALAGGG